MNRFTRPKVTLNINYANLLVIALPIRMATVVSSMIKLARINRRWSLKSHMEIPRDSIQATSARISFKRKSQHFVRNPSSFNFEAFLSVAEDDVVVINPNAVLLKVLIIIISLEHD